MEKKTKLNFFKKLFLAITDFRFYPYILKTENLGKSFWHFMKLTLILSLVITTYISNNVFMAFDEIVYNFDYNDPYKEQTIKIFDEDLTISFPKKYSADELKIIIDEYQGDKMVKVQMTFLIFLLVFITYTIVKICSIAFVSLFVSIMCSLFRIGLDARNYFKLAIYVMTLPYILEVMSILLVGTIKDYTITATTLLTIVYVFYAVRAVKFDAFLIIMNNNKKE